MVLLIWEFLQNQAGNGHGQKPPQFQQARIAITPTTTIRNVLKGHMMPGSRTHMQGNEQARLEMISQDMHPSLDQHACLHTLVHVVWPHMSCV